MFKSTWIFKGFCCKLSIFLVLRFRNSFLQSFFRGFLLLDFIMADTHTEEKLHSSFQLASHMQILIGSPMCAILLVATFIFNNIYFKFLFTLVLIIANCCCTSAFSIKFFFSLRNRNKLCSTHVVELLCSSQIKTNRFQSSKLLSDLSSLSYKSHAHLFCKNRYHKKSLDSILVMYLFCQYSLA